MRREFGAASRSASRDLALAGTFINAGNKQLFSGAWPLGDLPWCDTDADRFEHHLLGDWLRDVNPRLR